MPTQGGLVRIYSHVLKEVEPFVADLLYRVGQQFTCGPLWAHDSVYGHRDVLRAVPLPDDARDGFGYGRRTGAGMAIDAGAQVALGEYTWYIGNTFAHHNEPTGVLDLNTSMSVRFGVPKGTSEQFRVSDADVREGFLSWADEFRLPDGTTCMRLRPFGGDLWLRSAELGAPGKDLGRMLWRQPESVTGLGHRVIHLAEAGEGYDIRGEPWKYLSSRDQSGRTWQIRNSKVGFGARLCLEVVGRYNEGLRKHPALRLSPPYEVVWSPPLADQHESRLYIPLTLK